MSTNSNINYKEITYYHVFPNKKAGSKKNIKSEFFRKMKEIYERGFNKLDFKKSINYKNDFAFLIYVKDLLVGYVFIRNETTFGINDPFFYNLVIDPKFQRNGYGTLLLNYIKQKYINLPLYCLVESANRQLHEWYDTREGIVYNNPSIIKPVEYIIYKFPNGSVHVEIPESYPIEKTITNPHLTIESTVGDDLINELDQFNHNDEVDNPFRCHMISDKEFDNINLSESDRIKLENDLD